MEWNTLFAARVSRSRASAIREIFKLIQMPGIISFAGGMPAPETFPVVALQEAAHRLLTEQPERALQYSVTEGYPPLRAFIAERLRCQGIPANDANVLITSGSQQAMDLVSKVFLDPGDRVLVERPTFSAALQTFSSYLANCVGAEVDDQGVLPEQVEVGLASGAKLIYVQPNFQNPAGTTLALERREQLIALADRRGVPIVEDDPYRDLRYNGEDLPPLMAIDARGRRVSGADDGLAGGLVIHMGSFSKLLAPGMRLGWIVAPRPVIVQLVIAKQSADLHTSVFDQMLAYEVVKDGFLERHVPYLRQVYRQRCRTMLEALARWFPPGVRWTKPEGGFFIWATLPEEVDAAAMLEASVEAGVAYVPGASFFAEDGRPPLTNTMRLNFSYCTQAVIEEGIQRLGRVLAHWMET